MAFTEPSAGDTILNTHVTQITGALNGTSGQGQVISLTDLSDAANYALTVKNKDSTNGYIAQFLNSAAAVIVGITQATVTVGKKIALTIGTVTTGENHFALTATWNAAGETFRGIYANITNTASHADSRVIDLQVGGTSVFAVDTSGKIMTIASQYPMGAVAANHHVESATLTSSASGTTAVTFANAYASAPRVTTGIHAAVANHTVAATSLAASGFDIAVRDNSSSLVAISVSWMAEGAD